MTDTVNLAELERKAFRSYFGDGLWDIYLGLLLLALSIPQLLFPTWSESKPERLGTYLILATLSWLALRAGKKYITVPRIGQVKVGPAGRARRQKTRIVMIIALLLNIAALIFVLLINAGRVNAPWFAGLGNLIVPVGLSLSPIVIFGLAAHFLAYSRLYIIGVLFALPSPITEFVEQSFGVDISVSAFLISSGIVIAMGVVTFVRFMRENLVPADPELPEARQG